MSPKRIEPNRESYSGRCASRLRLLREKAKLSQEDVAKACGVSSRSVYRWEAGGAEPAYDALAVLASLYGLKSPRMMLSEK